MAVQFTKAIKEKSRLRMALIGPSGSGKTYTALRVGAQLKNGGRVAVIDTERGSASKYADLFDFDVLELETFSPVTYVEAIKAAESAGYSVLVIDSLSHAWSGKEGALEQVDRVTARSQSRNSYAAWRDVTPMHNALIDAMIQSRCHIIATMRTKTDYVLEKDERTGKTAPRKIGLAPVQRDGMEYEFDVVGDLDIDNNFIVSKTRCPALHGQVINKPGEDLATLLNTWLTDGAEPAPRPVKQEAKPAPKAQEPPPPDFTIVEIPAGRHKGASLGYLVKSDPAYLEKVAKESQDVHLRESAAATLRFYGIWPQPQPDPNEPEPQPALPLGDDRLPV